MNIRKQSAFHLKGRHIRAEGASGWVIALTSYVRISIGRIAELVVSSLERTERIPESGLSNKVEGKVAHPISDVDLLRTIRQH